jgi:adenylyltransferase/sulfurtransferase
MSLSKNEQKRYSRQIILPNFESTGQEKLKAATISVIGLGALGSIIANNLARAGIGHLRLVDRDVVELENLHRQTLFTEDMLGQPKAMAAADYLNRVNSDIKLTPIVKDVNFSNIETIVGKSDIILDGTDNLETRFLINDFCVKSGIPWIYGGVVGTQGMSLNIIPSKTNDHSRPCFRCLVSEIPGAGALPTCDTYGILNTVPTIIGSLQSTEALKIILGSPDINQDLIYYDIWSSEFRSLPVPKNDSCKCCVKHDFEYLQVKKRTLVTSLCGQNSVQIQPIKSGDISLGEFKKKLSRVGSVKATEFTLDFSIDDYKITIFNDGRALIKGTTDEKVAKSLYTKYIGS